MKRSEFKKKIKPIIEECIKELIFEEGALSTIISEVRKTSAGNVIKEEKNYATNEKAFIARNKKLQKAEENRKKILNSAAESLGGVNVFEGTKPLTESQAGKTSGASHAISNVDPEDAGIDISNIPGVNVWKHLINK